MTDIEAARAARMRKRGEYLISLTSALDVTITPDDDKVEVTLKNEDGSSQVVAGPWKLFGVNHETGKMWPLCMAEFEAFTALCQFVAPLGYGHAEIAEAWEITREMVAEAMEKDRLKCN